MLTPVMSERPKVPRRHVDELRGATKLAIEATRGVTELVEAMHRDIASGPRVLGSPLAKPARVLTGLVYGSIKGVTNLIGAGVDAALARLAPVLGESAPGREREAVLAALNGVLGDYLQETHNPLAIVMSLRVDGQSLELQREVLAKEFPDNETRLLILVHSETVTTTAPRSPRNSVFDRYTFNTIAGCTSRPTVQSSRGCSNSSSARGRWTSRRSRCWVTAWAGWWRGALASRANAQDMRGGVSSTRWCSWAHRTTAHHSSVAASGCTS